MLLVSGQKNGNWTDTDRRDLDQLAVLVIWSSWVVPLPYLGFRMLPLTLCRTEMYVVLLAGSVPPMSPFFKRRFSKSFSQRHGSINGFSQDDETALTAVPTPSGQTGTYASVVGRKGNSNACLDSTENMLLAMGHGDILMSTKIDVGQKN